MLGVGIMMYLKIGLAVLVLSVVSYGVWYVKDMQNTIVVQKQNIDKLGEAVDEQQAVIKQNGEDVTDIKKYNEMQDALQQQLLANLSALDQRFNKQNAQGKQRDLGKLAVKNPAVIERIINKGTRNAQRCMEIATGAPLTESETNATKKSEINTECPGIANPNYRG